MKELMRQTLSRNSGLNNSMLAVAGLLALALLALALSDRKVQAETPPQGDTNSFAGTWRHEISNDPSFIEYETFTSDGGSVEINTGPAALSVGIGTWTRLGPREFLATMYKQTWRTV